MNNQKINQPVFIVGCTRSGTKLISRIIGGHKDNCLLTEHREKFHIPEDKSGVCECYIWWNNFEHSHWDRNGEPLVRTPLYNEEDIKRVKETYLRIAGNKRLIIKNPQNILRIPIIKKMFPDALFIFCVRNPWHGLQSRVISGKAKYLIASKKNLELKNDLLLKSIYSWKESIDVYNQEKDDNWHVVRYEDTVFNTKDTVKKVFDFLGMREDKEYFDRVCSMPHDLKHTFYPVKKAFNKSKFKKEIMDIVESGCKTFPYDASIDSVPGDAWHYYFAEKKYIDAKKIKLWITKRAKEIIKKIICFVFLICGGKKKLRVNPIIFGALSRKASTLIVQDNTLLRNIMVSAKKGDRVSFDTLQMQYYRLKHYAKVIVMDSKGVPYILLKNIDFSPSNRYNHMLTGEVEYIRNI